MMDQTIVLTHCAPLRPVKQRLPQMDENTMRTHGKPSGQLFPKRCPLCNRNLFMQMLTMEQKKVDLHVKVVISKQLKITLSFENMNSF